VPQKKSEILETLSDDLRKAYEDPEECFGTEYDPNDETCTKECVDSALCKSIVEAPTDAVEDQPTETEPAEAPQTVQEDPSPKVNETPQPPTEESKPMADEEKKAPEAPAEGAKKATPKGFGDRTAAKDQFGFTEGTKGSFIALKFAEAPISKADLLAVTNEKFGTDSSGRVNMVMYKMRDRGFKLLRAGKLYYVDGVTPQDKVDAAIATAEKAAEAAEAAKAAKKAKEKEAADKEG